MITKLLQGVGLFISFQIIVLLLLSTLRNYFEFILGQKKRTILAMSNTKGKYSSLLNLPPISSMTMIVISDLPFDPETNKVPDHFNSFLVEIEDGKKIIYSKDIKLTDGDAYVDSKFKNKLPNLPQNGSKELLLTITADSPFITEVSFVSAPNFKRALIYFAITVLAILAVFLIK